MNYYMKKEHIEKMCDTLKDRFEKLHKYYLFAKKKNYSPENIYDTLKQIDSQITVLEKNKVQIKKCS